jgi:predicted RNA-binding Zn ribbon-like protein
VVQDLVNTAGMPSASVPDLLDDRTAAQSWVDASVRTWGEQTGRTPPRIVVPAADLAALRDVRARVRDWLAGQAGDQARYPAAVGVSFRDGRFAYEPLGEGAAAVASLVHVEVLLASHTGTFARLKACMNPACGAAFYDASRNSTRVWHDMKTCGNVMNLRASRARRRGTTTP